MQEETEVSKEEVIEIDGDSLWEQTARGIILSYEQAYNKNNDKHELKFTLTITNHKVAMPDGNKDVAYLLVYRDIREKTKEGEEENKWEGRKLHEEMHIFKSMQERLNPNAPWKEQLFLNLITRLCGAGLEYAELLQRMKHTKIANEQPTTEERLSKIGLTEAKELPKPLTPDEQQYAEWVKKEKAKEGLL